MAKSKKHIQLLSPENYIRQKARNLPIYKCLINSEWKSDGMAEIVISRKHANDNLTTGIYMVDLYCLGVRDSLYHFNRPEYELDEMVEVLSENLEMIPVDYELAHNIIYAALEFSEDLGFKPYKEFTAVTQYILEEDTDAVELMKIECGMNGKPTFIKTEFFTESQSQKIINQLERAVGSGNYDIITEEMDIDEFDEFEMEDEFDLMEPEERKELFLQLTQNELWDLNSEEIDRLNGITESILFNDLTNDEAIDSFFDKWKNELEVKIDEAESIEESFGNDIDKCIENEIEILQMGFIDDQNNSVNKSFSFEQVFKGRDSVTELEMYKFQATKIKQIVLSLQDVFNKLEAQSLIIECLDISPKYCNLLQSIMSVTKTDTLTKYFNEGSQEQQVTTYQFKIQLKDISKPTVWRRILMPSNATFLDFHDAIQVAFGWEDAHLFMFSPKGYQSSPIIELDNEEDDNPFSRTEKLSAETLTLAEIFTHEKQTYTYIYDFGDDWIHTITLEKINTEDHVLEPILLKGKGACPPEDCGGAPGYEHLKNVMEHKIKPDYQELKEWLGLGPRESWDPDKFDQKLHQDILNDYFSE